MVPVVAWFLSKVGWKTVSEGVGVTKDATEIPKNLIETKKAHLEVEALKQEREERSRLIATPTYSETLEHSNTYRRIVQRLKSDQPSDGPFDNQIFMVLVVVLGAGALFGLADLFQKVLTNK